MKVLFLDESGDHNLRKIDGNYPLFLLGGIITDRAYAYGKLDSSIRQFKIDMFGHDGIILHTSDITRNRNGFERLKDRNFRDEFYCKINSLMSSLDYKVVTVAIDKRRHLQRYGKLALDPYFFSLEVIVERFVLDLISDNTKGVIVAESRGGTLDAQLNNAWDALKRNGTYYVHASKIKSRITDLHIMKKNQNISGLQVADLVLPPVARCLLGKRCTPDMKIVYSKFRRGPYGKVDGYGLIVLPRRR